MKLRYGSLTRFDTSDVLPLREVAQRSGVAESTVRTNLIRFHKNGDRFVRYKTEGRRSSIPRHLRERMADPETLVAMRFLPMYKRAEIHSRDFGIRVSLSNLRTIYKNH